VQLMVKPPLSKAGSEFRNCTHKERGRNTLIAQGSLDEGTRKSSVGSTESEDSILTTPHVDVDPATDRSSGMKTSPPSVSLASRAVRFSARDLASISRY